MTIRDNWILLKEKVRLRVYQNPFFNGSELSKEVIKSFKLKGVQRVFHGNPDALVILTREQIIKIPLGDFSLQRCQNNKQILNELKNTSIASFVPKFLEEGTINDQAYFIESKLPGIAIDVSISKMDYMVEKAADFITQFHKKTAKEVLVNETVFKNLVSCDFELLCSFLTSEYSDKLKQVESNLKGQLIGKKLKTVWFHGDYKIENVLFDTKTWEISGLIDWDLSIQQGLPLLDVLYLLLYKESLFTRAPIIEILKKRINSGFNKDEIIIMQNYKNALAINDDGFSSLLCLFWINHIVKRFQSIFVYKSQDRAQWIQLNVNAVIDAFLETQ